MCASELVAIPSVTNCPIERLEEVRTCGRMIAGILAKAGCEVKFYDQGKYPSLVAGFAGGLVAPVTLSGHFDVVPPHPDDSQFEARVEGDYLWGRGAADMKTVVSSMVVWLCRRQQAGPPYPPVNLMLVGQRGER